MTYETYINSQYWIDKRQHCVNRDVICKTCCHDGSIYSLQVHHSKYPPIKFIKDNLKYANWDLDDSENHILLCSQCHEAITNVIRARKYDKEIKVNAYKSSMDNNIRLGDLNADQESKFQINKFVPDAYAQRSTRRSIK